MAFTCEQVARRLTDLDEGGGTSVERIGLRVHLAFCRRCQHFVAQMKQVRSALSGGGQDVLAPASLQRALATFHSERQ
jgi:hypothetical protein